MSLIRIVTGFAAVAGLAACTEGSPVAPAKHAGVPRFDASAAAPHAWIIKNDGLCGMAGADANGNFIFGGIGTVTTVVENANRAILSCKGEGITNESASAHAFQGFLCGISLPSGEGFALTYESRATVSPNGLATLTCAYTKS